MSGTTLLGTVLLGTGYIYPTSGDPTRISYNDYDFPAINEIRNRFDRGNLSLSTYDRLRTNGLGFDQALVKSKDYTINGILSASTSALLETEIDTMIQACQKPNQILKIKRRDGTITQAYATVTQVDIPEKHYNITFIPYSVTITVLEPFMFAGPLLENEWLGQTGVFSEAVIYEAGNEIGLPFVLLQFNAGTSVSEVTVIIGDKSITVEEDFVSGDTLLINCKNKEVMKNSSTNLLFSGVFPELEFGSNTLTITTTGAYDADIYLLYYPSYA